MPEQNVANLLDLHPLKWSTGREGRRILGYWKYKIQAFGFSSKLRTHLIRILFSVLFIWNKSNRNKKSVSKMWHAYVEKNSSVWNGVIENNIAGWVASTLNYNQASHTSEFRFQSELSYALLFLESEHFYTLPHPKGKVFGSWTSWS